MGKFIDLTGKRFGRLLVVGRGEKRGKEIRWDCICDCGNKSLVLGHNLRGGISQSCGCLNKEICSNRDCSKNITGERFGRLVAIMKIGKAKRNTALWLCKCDCGVKKVIDGSSLRKGGTKSCGCLQKQNAKEMGRKNSIDLTGRRFGKLVVIGFKKTDNNKNKCVCRCSCGEMKVVYRKYLLKGITKDCGCERLKIKCNEMIGKKFGRLVIVEYYGSTKEGERGSLWLCKCDCGNTYVARTHYLRSGNTKSCGCIRKEMVGEKHQCWNPDKTKEERSKNRNLMPETSVWRNSVYKRDKYVCQACGYSKGGIIVAHHKNSFDMYKSERFIVENGVTCCKHCHNKFHKIYGYGKNTKEQWNTFVRLNNREIA